MGGGRRTIFFLLEAKFTFSVGRFPSKGRLSGNAPLAAFFLPVRDLGAMWSVREIGAWIDGLGHCGEAMRESLVRVVGKVPDGEGGKSEGEKGGKGGKGGCVLVQAGGEKWVV